MRRKRQTLVDVITKALTAHQESVLHVLQHYPDRPQRSPNLAYSLRDNIRRTTEAILNHLRTVEVEARAEIEQELFGEKVVE